ncbi:MAG: winged helix-turn-helix transcriptional regulator [Defluviicoccus sp.]|nr:MAG: winged helix-turn-helix transcriptional regulator [Defluviicoccus sp.]
MTAIDTRHQAGRIVMSAAKTMSVATDINSDISTSGSAGRNAGNCDRARLVFIQVSGPDAAHIRREIARDGCDLAIAEDANQARSSLAGDTLHVVDGSSSTRSDLAEDPRKRPSSAQSRRPLIVLLMPKCRADPEMSRLAMMLNSAECLSEGCDECPTASGFDADQDTKATSRSVLTRGDIEVDLTTYRACRDKRPLHLSLSCFRLLLALMETRAGMHARASYSSDAGRALPRPQAADRHHVSRLRRVLCAEGGRDVIRTVRGVGYAFSDRPNDAAAMM